MIYTNDNGIVVLSNDSPIVVGVPPDDESIFGGGLVRLGHKIIPATSLLYFNAILTHTDTQDIDQCECFMEWFDVFIEQCIDVAGIGFADRFSVDSSENLVGVFKMTKTTMNENHVFFMMSSNMHINYIKSILFSNGITENAFRYLCGIEMSMGEHPHKKAVLRETRKRSAILRKENNFSSYIKKNMMVFRNKPWFEKAYRDYKYSIINETNLR